MTVEHIFIMDLNQLGRTKISLVYRSHYIADGQFKIVGGVLMTLGVRRWSCRILAELSSTMIRVISEANRLAVKALQDQGIRLYLHWTNTFNDS